MSDEIKVVRLRVGYVLAGAPSMPSGTVVALPAPHADRLLSKGRAVAVDMRSRTEPAPDPVPAPDPGADAFLNPDVEVDGNRDQL